MPYQSIYIGDFNSHHTSWGYEINNNNGEILYNWMIAKIYNYYSMQKIGKHFIQVGGIEATTLTYVSSQKIKIK